MNKKCLTCILFILMIILSGCVLKNKAKGSDQLPAADSKVYENNGAVSKNSTPEENVQNNSNDIDQDKNTKPEPEKEQQPLGQTTFKQGAMGDEVKEIQEKLNKIDYDLDVDGDFGSSTYSNNELEVFINSKTFSSLTTYFIWIDLTHQKVNIFKSANTNWQLVKSMACSSGKASTPTVKGNFTVGIKGSYFIADSGARCKYYTQISLPNKIGSNKDL